MNFETFKDPLIVSFIFFAVASDWLDAYIREMFPQLKTTNPVVFTIIKTLMFFTVYFIYQKFINTNSTINKQPIINGKTPLPYNQVTPTNTTTVAPAAPATTTTTGTTGN